MYKTAFKKLLVLVRDDLKTNFRSEGISPEDRVVITLQYLSQGIIMQTLACISNIGYPTVQKIILGIFIVMFDSSLFKTSEE